MSLPVDINCIVSLGSIAKTLVNSDFSCHVNILGISFFDLVKIKISQCQRVRCTLTSFLPFDVTDRIPCSQGFNLITKTADATYH